MLREVSEHAGRLTFTLDVWQQRGRNLSYPCGVRQYLLRLAIASVFSPSPISAQTTATVLGIVKDASGAVIPKARVTVRQYRNKPFQNRYNR